MTLRSMISIVISLLAVELSFADDWPQWRGIDRDAVWRESGIVDRLPAGQLPLEWSVEIGPGYTGPTVAEGRVYVMDRMAEESLERILCFDSKTGEELWKHVYPSRYTISYTAGPRASVTIDAGRAYAVGAMGHFFCLDAASGQVIWQRDLQKEYDVDLPIWGIAGSPLVYRDLVIQQVGGAGDACMVAFNTEDGKERWRSISGGASYSSPVITRQADQDVLVCWTASGLSGLNPLTGDIYWFHPMPASRMPIGIATPSIDNNLVFVSSFYDGSMLVRLDPNELTSQLVWRAVGKDEQNTESLHSMIGTPLILGDYIYGVDSYGEFRCLEAETGRRVWQDDRAVPRNRWATIHMVQHEDRVWMFNDRGNLLITQLSPEGLSILSQTHLIDPTRVQLNRRDGVCWSHPAYAEQSIFARNDQRLVRASLRQ
jgi:outer membrane protein assembly factor BamB